MNDQTPSLRKPIPCRQQSAKRRQLETTRCPTRLKSSAPWPTSRFAKPRLRHVLVTLDGLRPGILENRKANARLLMQTMVERLGERHELGELTIGSKPVAGPPSDSTVDALRNGADFILIGSCD